jgi:hypothetical protein
MVRVYGCEISEPHALRLIGKLGKNGSPAAVAAAGMISQGVSGEGTAGKLTPEMRDAILIAIDVPHPGLRTLQRALLNDQRARA